MRKQLIIVLMVTICTLSFAKTFGDWETGKINGNEYITTHKGKDNDRYLRIEKINGKGFRIIASIDKSLGKNSDSKLIFFKTKDSDLNFVMITGKFWDLKKHGKNYKTTFHHMIKIDIQNYTSRMDIYQDLILKFKKNNKIKIFASTSMGNNIVTEFSLVGFNQAYKYLISK